MSEYQRMTRLGMWSHSSFSWRRLAQFVFGSRFSAALFLIIAVIASGATGYMLIEGWTFLDSLYMTVITVGTIGYGETHPLSPAGRVFTMGLIIVSLMTIGFAVSTLAAFIVEGEFNRILQGQRMEDLIAKMKNHIIVCGVGDTGKYVAEELHKTETPFVIIERDVDAIKALKNLGGVAYVQGDATDNDTLRRAGIDRAKGLVSSLGDDKDNVFVVLSARALNRNLRIITRLVNEENHAKLLIAGADEVVSPNVIGGLRMASVMIRPSVVTFLDEMLRSTGQVMRVEEFHVNDAPTLIGQTLETVNIEQRTGVLVVALKSPAGGYQFNPAKRTVLQKDDILIVMGPRERLSALHQFTPS